MIRASIIELLFQFEEPAKTATLATLRYHHNTVQSMRGVIVAAKPDDQAAKGRQHKCILRTCTYSSGLSDNNLMLSTERLLSSTD